MTQLTVEQLYFRGLRGSEIAARLHAKPEDVERQIAICVQGNPALEVVHYMNRGSLNQSRAEQTVKARFVIQDDQHYERVNRFDAR